MRRGAAGPDPPKGIMVNVSSGVSRPDSTVMSPLYDVEKDGWRAFTRKVPLGTSDRMQTPAESLVPDQGLPGIEQRASETAAPLYTTFRMRRRVGSKVSRPKSRALSSVTP